MRLTLRTWLTLAALALSACAQTPQEPPQPKTAEKTAPPEENFLLLPDLDGKVGAISITVDGQSKTLDKANQGVAVDIAAKTLGAPTIWTKKRIDSTFGDALALQPKPPKTFILNFKDDGATLTEASAARLQSIIEEAKARGDYHLIVAGHTGQAGTAEQNKRLSMKWALLARKTLADRGLDPAKMALKAYGESLPSSRAEGGGDPAATAGVEITVQ